MKYLVIGALFGLMFTPSVGLCDLSHREAVARLKRMILGTAPDHFFLFGNDIPPGTLRVMLVDPSTLTIVGVYETELNPVLNPVLDGTVEEERVSEHFRRLLGGIRNLHQVRVGTGDPDDEILAEFTSSELVGQRIDILPEWFRLGHEGVELLGPASGLRRIELLRMRDRASETCRTALEGVRRAEGALLTARANHEETKQRLADVNAQLEN